MSNLPPTSSHTSGTMRIGPFWKRAAELAPTSPGPAGDEPFDALTDLFLGEVAGARTPASGRSSSPETVRTLLREGTNGGVEQARPSSGPSAKLKTGDGPALRLAGGEDEEYQLAPVPDAASTGEIATRPSAPVLTMETVAEDEGEARPVQGLVPQTRNPVLELLVLGNLPVVAGAWASQYVREIAEAAGKPVAYLRQQGEYVSLELVGALADVAGAPGLDDVATLDDAIDAAAEITDRWIVRCDAGQEKHAAACGIMRAVTILTGGDQTAREACRVAVQGLAGRLSAEQADRAMMRLAVMGGQHAAEGTELAEMAAGLLGRPVAAMACGAKIGGVRPPHPLFSGSTEQTLATILAGVERALVPDGVGAEMFAAPSTTALSGSEAQPQTIQHAAADIGRDEPEAMEDAEELASLAEIGAAMPVSIAEIPLPEPKPTMAEVAMGAAPSVEPMRHIPEPPLARERMEPVERVAVVASVPGTVSRPMGPEVMPTVQVWSNVPAAETADSNEAPAALSSHLTGMAITPVRCPYAAGVEIAIDDAGGLHLMTRSRGGEAEDSTLAALLVASAWTETHAGLLRVSIGRGGGATKPTLHLFTDTPKRSRRLLETNLRIHLLAEVSVGAERGWYCTDLN